MTSASGRRRLQHAHRHQSFSRRTQLDFFGKPPPNASGSQDAPDTRQQSMPEPPSSPPARSPAPATQPTQTSTSSLLESPLAATAFAHTNSAASSPPAAPT